MLLAVADMGGDVQPLLGTDFLRKVGMSYWSSSSSIKETLGLMRVVFSFCWRSRIWVGMSSHFFVDRALLGELGDVVAWRRSRPLSMSKRSPKPVTMAVTLISSARFSSMTTPMMMLASSWTFSWTVLLTASKSSMVMVDEPVILTSTPLAPETSISSSSGLEMAHLAASTARFSPLAIPIPIMAMPRSPMMDLTSAKSTLMKPGGGDQVGDALHRLTQDVIGRFEGVQDAERAGRDIEKAIIGDDDQGVHMLFQLADPLFGLCHALLALARERLGDDADGQRSGFSGNLGNDRCRAGAGAAAHAGGDEDHIGALEHLSHLLPVFEGRVTADVGVGAGSQPFGQLRTQLHLDRRLGVAQRLGIGIGNDKIDFMYVIA